MKLQKMKVKVASKKILKRRKRKNSEVYVPPNEVTEGSLQIWRTLPEKIRQDPSLASFRQEHERIHGTPEIQITNPDEDPLPNEDNSVSEKESNDGQSHNDLVTINVNNDDQDQQHLKLSNGDKANNTAASDHDDVDIHQHFSTHHHQNKYVKFVKMAVLLAIWVMFTIFLMSKNEKVLTYKQLAIPIEKSKTYVLEGAPIDPRIGINIQGAFLSDHSPTNDSNFLEVFLQLVYRDITNGDIVEDITEIWRIPVVDTQFIDTAAELKKKYVFRISSEDHERIKLNETELRVHLKTNFTSNLAINLAYDPSPIDRDIGIIYAAIVLLGLYVLIIWELVHRTFAAIIASTLSIGVLAFMNERPPMTLIISWIDVETLLLLFGMMILVAILSETGIFDFLAVLAYKITNGKVWPLINCLCLFTAVVSAFLDNVTTVLLMTPVTIRLCEVMELNPVPILMSMVIYSNIGGTLTPVGDPPNVIIASNSYISKNGVNFTTFTAHMFIGVCMVMVQAYFQLRFKFRNLNDLRFKEPGDVQELRHEIAVWQRAAASLSSYSKDEDLVRETLLKKVNRLGRQLKKKLASGAIPTESYKATLEELQAKYPIRNKKLLVKSGITLVFVISFFFLHSVPDLQRLSLGWTALLGAVLLLILADREDMEAVLARVEWSTLLFFAALFVLMEALSELGLIDWIGKQTENVILSVGEESRLAVAILIILWVSALASAFVDNIPLTTMMVKIAISLAENEALDLPLQPLVWALALGACLGGNGTLIGASANVVCAGVAEQHGYRFTFVEFFKVGFPVMIGSIIVATVYLMFAHVVFTWH